MCQPPPPLPHWQMLCEGFDAIIYPWLNVSPADQFTCDIAIGIAAKISMQSRATPLSNVCAWFREEVEEHQLMMMTVHRYRWAEFFFGITLVGSFVTAPTITQ